MFLSRNYHKITTNLRVFLYHYALAHFGVDRCFLWLGQSSVKVTQKAGLMTPRKIRRFDSPNKPPLRSTEVLHKALESMRTQFWCGHRRGQQNLSGQRLSLKRMLTHHD
jgi:hypothetical protein